MFQALLPVLFLGLFQPSVPIATNYDVLNALQIAPPSVELPTIASVSASGVVIIDAKTGQVVYDKYPEQKRPMASITKLMTALIIAEHHNMDEVVQIPHVATTIEGHKAYLKAYDQFTIGQLLSAVLISSANDAAVALAIHHSGSVDQFVLVMNQRAVALGLQHTSYANSTGLDHPRQFSTPKDIAWLTMYVQSNPHIAQRMQKRGARIVSKRGNEVNLYHTHSLMHKNQVPGKSLVVKGGKTGTTGGAKQCLVSLVESENNEYIVVLLHSQNRYGDLTKIMGSLEPKRVVGYHSSSL